MNIQVTYSKPLISFTVARFCSYDVLLGLFYVQLADSLPIQAMEPQVSHILCTLSCIVVMCSFSLSMESLIIFY